MQVQTEEVYASWKKFILINDHGMEVHVLNYGGIITKIIVPDREGKLENVVLGYENDEDYLTDANFLGAIMGPVAGRIQGASFRLNGNTYHLEKNEGTNLLHCGSSGFHRAVWAAEPFEAENRVGVTLSYFRKNGEGGFPGNLTVKVTYTLNNENELILDYDGKSDRDTPVTMTNHSYFNLSGDLKDTIHDHIVRMNSRRYLELDNTFIPTGNIVKADETVFDFSDWRKLKDGITARSEQNVLAGNGYDHYFMFHKGEKGMIEVKEDRSGRALRIETDQPGLVMYTGNNINIGGNGKYFGVCFETQGSPASLHHHHLPGIILKKNEEYKKQTIFSFSIV